MITSLAGRTLIKKYEGVRLEAYKCPAGVWTIGYGHTKGVKKGDVITLEEAEELLKEDLGDFEGVVESAVKVDITQNQFDALVSLTYNIGPGAFRKSTVLKRLNEGDFKGAAEALTWFNKGGGKVLKGLVKRRAEEKQLFLAEL